MSLDDDKLSEYYDEVGFDLDPPGDDDEYVQSTVSTQIGIPVQVSLIISKLINILLTLTDVRDGHRKPSRKPSGIAHH